MIPYQNCEVYWSLLFFIATKIVSYIHVFSMSRKKRAALSSIPENHETDEENPTTKWVPKKKHEVLKAKYKCLKKLFQVYDASLIGVLPEHYGEPIEDDTRQRLKRSHMTKTDSFEGVIEVSNGDASVVESISTEIIRDINTARNSQEKLEAKYKYAATQDSRENITCSTDTDNCNVSNTINMQPVPYMLVNERRKKKLTRFQCFLHRILGITRESAYKPYVLPNGHIYSFSENNIYHKHREKRRRRGLRFRRLRRPRKIKSESALDGMKSPVMMSYVQSVQRSCLMDTTSRQCPIVGCGMMFYGIINYNDHLNLCHFPERKFICHYCHEGFEKEQDKYIHENEHIGITKLNINRDYNTSPDEGKEKKAIEAQTEPVAQSSTIPEDKLKKIVSYFDKMVDCDAQVKNKRFSDSNLGKTKTLTESCCCPNCDKRCTSYTNQRYKTFDTSVATSLTSTTVTNVKCKVCGESFDNRRQLSLHVDLEHRGHGKYSKFHSCAGITTSRPRKTMDMTSRDGEIIVESSVSGVTRINTCSTLSQNSTSTNIRRRKSEESVSTNIELKTSEETLVKKSSTISNLVQKVKSGVNFYKWEPGTKIIRV